jgi:hypothetical protein
MGIRCYASIGAVCFSCGSQSCAHICVCVTHRHGYISSLPERGESVPLLWTHPEAHALLNGTELEGKIQEQRFVRAHVRACVCVRVLV